MVTVKYEGRLGNNLIQYVTAFLLSKKFNLNTNFVGNNHSINFGDFFSLPKITNGKIGNILNVVTDVNFLEIYNNNKPNELFHYHLDGYFQKKEFLQKNKNEILSLFNLKYDERNEDEVFVHYRIGDIIDDRRMLPIEYYMEALDKINPSGGYISSDTLNHKFCLELIKKYNLKPFMGNELETINFGKNFKNLVISEGTFSWWIAFLSKSNNVYCNQRDYRWYGDINLDNWIKLSWDYDKSVITNTVKLNGYLPIKNLK